MKRHKRDKTKRSEIGSSKSLWALHVLATAWGDIVPKGEGRDQAGNKMKQRCSRTSLWAHSRASSLEAKQGREGVRGASRKKQNEQRSYLVQRSTHRSFLTQT